MEEEMDNLSDFSAKETDGICFMQDILGGTGYSDTEAFDKKELKKKVDLVVASVQTSNMAQYGHNKRCACKTVRAAAKDDMAYGIVRFRQIDNSK